MEWFRSHPYFFALGVAAAIVIIGALVVVSRLPAEGSSSTVTWQGGVPPSAYQSGTSAQSSPTPQEIAQEVIQGQSGENVVIPTLSPATSSSDTSASSSIDYVSLLAELSANSSGKNASATSSSADILSQAYQFIPQGLIATAPQQKQMTASQQALYLYGNAVGGEIQSFETLHTNSAQILKDQSEDRTDPIKAAALVNLGQDLTSVGTFMQGMQEVPSSVVALHSALAQSYQDIGAKLQLVAQAKSDADFVQAAENYDTSADTFVRNYAALAQYFAAQGIVFSAQDPGNVFSFSETGGV